MNCSIKKHIYQAVAAIMIASLFLFLNAGCAERSFPQASTEKGSSLARSHVVTIDGFILPLRAWWPKTSEPRAIVVALHGFNDYGRAFVTTGLYLSAQGIALIAYDQRGFGLSPGYGRWAGENAYIQDLYSVTKDVRAQHPRVPIYVLGESMGGAIAIAALASKKPPEIDGLILSAPAVWSRDMMPWYQSALLAMAAATFPEMELTGSGLKIQASDNIDMLIGLGRDPRVIKSTRVAAIDGLTDVMDTAQKNASQLKLPVLILYGQQDQVIPPDPIMVMAKKIPKTTPLRMALYPEGYHLLLRDLGARKPLADIASWIEDHQKPLPSGLDYNIEP